MHSNIKYYLNICGYSTKFLLFLSLSLFSFLQFQERHHYTAANIAFTPLGDIQKRDEKKLALAKEKDITLVVIPCWWDGKQER